MESVWDIPFSPFVFTQQNLWRLDILVVVCVCDVVRIPYVVIGQLTSPIGNTVMKQKLISISENGRDGYQENKMDLCFLYICTNFKETQCFEFNQSEDYETTA